MHNTERANIEFQITFTESNLWYLRGDTNPNLKLIQQHEKTLADLKAKLAKLKESGE